MLHFSEVIWTKSIAVQENRSQNFICLDLKLSFCNCKFKYNWTMSYEILFGLFFMDFSICILRQDNFFENICTIQWLQMQFNRKQQEQKCIE